MAYWVQSSLIPKEIPQYPGWEFAACWRPARQVSGDFYDFIEDQGDCIYVVIADVTDKGMPAALFMALARSLVRSSLDQSRTLAAGITRANRLICADSTLNMPVTLFASQIDLGTGRVTYVNAGHNPPLFYSTDKEGFLDLKPTGMFLGFDERAQYIQKSFTMAPGDFMVCYTDGVLDAVNTQGETFKIERFQKVVRENLDTSAPGLVEAIETSVNNFSGDRSLYDDLTILIVNREG
jgi:sigma-B regulation protein RsbU (phosphoserine phosphatase)